MAEDPVDRETKQRERESDVGTAEVNERCSERHLKRWNLFKKEACPPAWVAACKIEARVGEGQKQGEEEDG